MSSSRHTGVHPRGWHFGRCRQRRVRCSLARARAAARPSPTTASALLLYLAALRGGDIAAPGRRPAQNPLDALLERRSATAATASSATKPAAALAAPASTSAETGPTASKRRCGQCAGGAALGHELLHLVLAVPKLGRVDHLRTDRVGNNSLGHRRVDVDPRYLEQVRLPLYGVELREGKLARLQAHQV